MTELNCSYDRMVCAAFMDAYESNNNCEYKYNVADCGKKVSIRLLASCAR